MYVETPIDAVEITNLLRCRGSRMFSSTPGVFFNYTLARDTGRLAECGGGHAVIVQRFQTNPRFRIYQIDVPPRLLIQIAQALAETRSYRPVRIENLLPSEVEELQRLDPTGVGVISEEAVLDCQALVDRPQEFYTKRAWEMVRSNLRTMTWHASIDRHLPTGDQREDYRRVIDLWKQLNAAKHFRLSITRDYRAIDSWFADLRLLGYRGENPSCLHILTHHIVDDTLAVELVEKSLNYSSVPGGKPGTSDTNFYRVAQLCLTRGITHINLGTWDGGNAGLGKHKLMLTHGTPPILTGTFTTSFKDRRFA